jgi:hypothetical protein
MAQRWRLNDDMKQQKPLAYFLERHISFVMYPTMDRLLDWLKARLSVASKRQAAIFPFIFPALTNLIYPNSAHFEALCNFRRFFAPLNGPKHPIPQVL